MVAKPLCPLYKNIIKPLDRARYPELRYKVAAWRNGALHFYQTPLTDVAKELERRYHCKISFRQGEVFENLISGEHDNQSLESVLESLHYICGINYEKDGNQITFYK